MILLIYGKSCRALIDTMNEEMKSMYDNDVCDLVQLPKGLKPIGCKWIFKTKRDSKGNTERYKHVLLQRVLLNMKATMIMKPFLQYH